MHRVRTAAFCLPVQTPYHCQHTASVGTPPQHITLHHAGDPLEVVVEVVPDADRSRSAEATGYSARYSFEEAFREAVRQLPPPSSPDELMEYTVAEIGAHEGGIAGWSHLYVKVRTAGG